MDKIARIRQEVGRLMELNNASMESTKKISRISAAGYYEALVDVENFLDTLSKEPDTPEFPETFEICLYDGRTHDNEKCTECSTTCSVRKEEPDKSLEEAANEFANQDCVTFISRKKGFIAGAEWQKEQDMDEWIKDRDGCFWDGVEEGKKAMKEQMLKDAEECELYWDGDFLAIDLNMAALGYSEKDKVKVIVIKEEE